MTGHSKAEPKWTNPTRTIDADAHDMRVQTWRPVIAHPTGDCVGRGAGTIRGG